MSKWQLTKSTQFLVRPLGLVHKNEFLNEFCEIRSKLNFLNAYIADKDHVNVLECPLYLLFRPRLKLAFENFVNKEYDKGHLVEDYSYEDGYVVLLYEYPKELQNDYKKILAGKYSQTSKMYKDIFPEIDHEGNHTLQHLVLNRHEELRKYWYNTLNVKLDEKDELFSVFFPEEETLDISKIKNT